VRINDWRHSDHYTGRLKLGVSLRAVCIPARLRADLAVMQGKTITKMALISGCIELRMEGKSAKNRAIAVDKSHRYTGSGCGVTGARGKASRIGRAGRSRCPAQSPSMW